jgi:hypothetical protein
MNPPNLIFQLFDAESWLILNFEIVSSINQPEKK